MKKSVIIATYNGEKYLEEQLVSILSQTVCPDEVIISDDGSTDNTLNIAKKFIGENGLGGNWKVEVNVQNKGYARNFLEAAIQSSGDIVFFCDQDDIWMPDRIEKMSHVMENHLEINLLCTNLEPFYCDESTRKWDKKTLSEMTNDGSIASCSLSGKDYHLKRSGCTMCARRDFVEDIYSYWIPGWPHDDFLWKMAACSNSAVIFQYTSMKRRMHSSNASVLKIRSRQWRIKEIDLFIATNQKLEEYVSNINLTTKNITETLKLNDRALTLRSNMLKKRNIFVWPVLAIKYKDTYPRIKGLYLDLYLCLFKDYKGAN